MSDFTHEIAFEDFDALIDTWHCEPDKRPTIETALRHMGFTIEITPIGDTFSLDITIPDHIYIAAPPELLGEDQS